jgi:protein TonB
VIGRGTGSGGEGNGSGSGDGGDGNGNGRATAPRWIKGRLKDSDYPREAGRAGIGGTVEVRYAVEVDGRVTHCTIIRSSGDAQLDETTCRLLEQRYRYRPAKDSDGRPVRSLVEESHSWIIEEDPGNEHSPE